MNASSPRRRGYTLAILTVVAAFNAIDRQIVAVLAEPIRADLALTDTQLGLLSGLSYAIFYAGLGVPIAMLAERRSRRTIIAVCLAIFSLMTALSGFVLNFMQLLLARIGVGIGEAGTNAPSHSMISDLYAREERPTAMGIWGLSHAIGPLAGFLIGGIVAQYFGWRAAFMLVGLPGIVVAVLIMFTISEPRRGASEVGSVHHSAADLPTALRFLFRQRAYLHLCAAQATVGFAGYATLFWTGGYLIRTFGLNVSQVGISMAIMLGGLGIVGTYYGGQLASRLGRRDVRWILRVPAIAIASAVPFACAFYLAPNVGWALVLAIWPALTISSPHGPVLSMMQSSLPSNFRTIGSAVFGLLTSTFALGLGPLATGVFSDLIRMSTGYESLRYALVLSSLMLTWGAFHFWRASVHLPTALAAVENGPVVQENQKAL